MSCAFSIIGFTCTYLHYFLQEPPQQGASSAEISDDYIPGMKDFYDAFDTKPVRLADQQQFERINAILSRGHSFSEVGNSLIPMGVKKQIASSLCAHEKVMNLAKELGIGDDYTPKLREFPEEERGLKLLEVFEVLYPTDWEKELRDHLSAIGCHEEVKMLQALI